MHGIAFHYFQDEHPPFHHIPCQGSLTQRQFEWVIDKLEERYTILQPEEFINRYLAGDRSPNQICLCFYCGLKSQFDLALPVLEARGLRAFWFLYTAMFCGEIVKIEQYHHFRSLCFDTADDFYDAFFAQAAVRFGRSRVDGALEAFDPASYLAWSDYYTPNDKRYKYLRDRILTVDEYETVMGDMIDAVGYDVEAYRGLLWLREDDVRYLARRGHMTGLHTHSHPYDVCALPLSLQKQEYETNRNVLQEITGGPVISMAHPCNSYSAETLKILRDLGITIGFRSNYDENSGDVLEVPCMDHATLLRKWG